MPTDHVLSATSTRLWNTSRDGDCTTSLCSLCHCSTALSEKKLFPVSNLSLFQAQTFHVDLLQHMEKNSKMDVQFISESQKQYELEYRRKANNLEKCTTELWRMERARDKNVREMKESRGCRKQSWESAALPFL